MSEGSDISALNREFADALTEVLAENAVGPARRGRLARARAAVKHHREYSEAGYLRAVDAALRIGKRCKRLVVSSPVSSCEKVTIGPATSTTRRTLRQALLRLTASHSSADK
jgi:hypothetical protein